MKVRLNEQSLEWLHDKRIFHGHRLRAGGTLQWRPDAKVEPYIGLYHGEQAYSIGSFSYSHSALPVSFSLGRYCSVAWGVQFPGPRHPVELLTTAGFMCGSRADMWSVYLADTGGSFGTIPPNPQKSGTVIGHDVWIGQDVTIMPGLKIGDGAAIAAAAVVTKDVEPFAIVGGNPARLIRWRFPENIRNELAELRWWRFGFSLLNQIDLSDIKASIRDLRERCADTPEFRPDYVDLMEMPHSGVL